MLKVSNEANSEMQSGLLGTNSNIKSHNRNGNLQNGQITQFYFHKLLKLQFCLSLTILVNFVNIVVATTLTFPELTPQNQSMVNVCLNFNIICLIVQFTIIFMRVQTVLKHEKQQKLIYKKASILNTKKIFYIIIQYMIVIVQPYSFLIGLKYKTQDAFNDFGILYPVNDLLAILSLFRLYMIFRTFLVLTPYMNNRSNRLCNMYGCKADFIFSLKCLFKDSPLLLVFVFFSLSALIFAYALYIAERQLILYQQATIENTCNTYFNALWLVAMTVTTVGYGDYFPHTTLGRMITLFVAIWGTFIVSIMVVVVANTLNMQKNQKRTVIILDKIYGKDDLKQKAGKFLGSFVISKYFSLKNPQKANKYKNVLESLKKDFSELNRQIKMMTDNDDIYDEIAYHFLNLNSDIQILNDNQNKIINFIHENLQYDQKKKQN